MELSGNLLTQILLIVENVRIFSQGLTKAARITATFLDVFIRQGSTVAEATNAHIEKVLVYQNVLRANIAVDHICRM